TAPVASFPANAFGVFDMLGNAWEWTEDCWSDSLAGHPQDAKARNDGDCGQRVIRGGSWFSSKSETFRTAFRIGEAANTRVSYIGFRVARDF
ncbi:MAG: formylglycine-generating enzyme family protein, partial [Alphaproteobacteria bacterium]|nr:formylglycine-generating enzyme family protein [Alphaproteobacteria bacterium]